MSIFTRESRDEVHKAAIDKWGDSLQAIVAIEELSELQKEICKHFRGADNLDAIAEEIADVIIVIEQLQVMLNLRKQVEKMLDAKTLRLLGRVGGKYDLTTAACEPLVSCLEEVKT